MAWRDSGLSVKIFGLDGICLVPLVLLLVHFTEVTFYILVATVVGTHLLTRRGWTLKILYITIRRKLHGDYRPTSVSLRALRRRGRW